MDTKDKKFEDLTAAIVDMPSDLVEKIEGGTNEPLGVVKSVMGESFLGFDIALAVNIPFPSGQLFAPHSHPNAAEWVYCKSGSLSGLIIYHPTPKSPPPKPPPPKSEKKPTPAHKSSSLSVTPGPTFVAKWTIEKGQAVYFPQGYIHYVLNPTSGESGSTLMFEIDDPETISVTETLAALVRCEPGVLEEAFEGQLGPDCLETFLLDPSVIQPPLGGRRR